MEILLAIFVLVPMNYYAFAWSVHSTLIHIGSEIVGTDETGPFWRYAERLTGIEITDFAGNILFGLLALALTVVGFGAYICRDARAAGLLLGLRLGDAIFSHAGLAILYRRPNPGLWSSTLYVVEAAIIIYLCQLDALAIVVGLSVFGGFWLLVGVRAARNSHRAT